jgi:hypothetical protein
MYSQASMSLSFMLRDSFKKVPRTIALPNTGKNEVLRKNENTLSIACNGDEHLPIWLRHGIQ